MFLSSVAMLASGINVGPSVSQEEIEPQLHLTPTVQPTTVKLENQPHPRSSKNIPATRMKDAPKWDGLCKSVLIVWQI